MKAFKDISFAVILGLAAIVGGLLVKKHTSQTVLIHITQEGQSGEQAPVMKGAILIKDSVATDTVLHGGQMYTPTVYYYTYQVDLSKFTK